MSGAKRNGKGLARAGALILALALSARATPGGAERATKVSLGGPDAVLVRAGRFQMGSDDAEVERAVALCRAYSGQPESCQPFAFASEQPKHEVVLRAYRIDRREVSRRDYLRCVAEAACVPPRTSELDLRVAKAEHPVTGILAAEARAYCAFVGGRLPTEAEWEHAARGSGSRSFPWGTQWNARLANHGASGAQSVHADGFEHAAPVGTFPDGKSAYGVLDMAGNVWEITADRYADDAYARSARHDPQGPSDGSSHVIRGGSFASPPHTLRAAARAPLPDHEIKGDVGFRCAYDQP
jgi:formylglycine-generating enzyme required for sulfatase activity